MLEMQKVAFGRVGQLFDGPHATPTRRTEGPYFLNIASLKSGRLDLSESDHVSAEDFVKWTRRVTPQPGDLLFSYETRLGEAALMPGGIEACLGRRMALLRPDRSVVDPRFLLYFYLSPAFQETISRNTIHGATVPRIGLATMPRWEVEIPVDLRVQQRVGEALGAIDDKIAANDRMLDISDQLCAAMVSEVASRGTRCHLRDLILLNYGKALPSSRRSPGGVVVYGSGGPAGTHSTALVSRAGIVVGRKGTVGAVYWADGPHYPIDTTYYVEPLEPATDEVLYYILRSMPLGQLNSDSAVPGLNREEAYAQEVKVPPPNARVTLSALLRTRFSWMASVRNESRKLAATRDELLPLLISGQIRVRDAEKVVEEVV